MRRTNSSNPSYWWLKAIVIISVIAVAVLLLTKQYLILVELAICGIGGYVLYRIIKNKLENPSKPKKVIEQPEVKVIKTEQKQINEIIDIRKITTKDLIDELSRRGEIR